MTKRFGVPVVLACLVALMGVRATTQQLPPGYIDPQPILAAAEKAIGSANLKCVTIAGATVYAGAVGQARESARNVDWPRTEMANYTRTMNWDARTMREEFDRKPGLTPAAYKYGTGWVDGPPQQNAHQTWVVNGNRAWYMDGSTAPVAVTPELAEIYQVDMWLNPHGFLKAARLPGANPKATWRWELGEMGRDGPTVKPERMRVVSIMFNGKYRIDATVNKENMLQRIHTWVPDPAIGDMNYEHEFTNDSYIDIGNGIRFPTGWHSHQGWDDNYGAQGITAGHNAFGGALKDVRANVCPDPGPVPQMAEAPSPTRVETQKIGNGVYLFRGGTHNSVAVEFRDFIAVFEAGQNEERSLAVIDEMVKLMPDKPIRWVINSHQHFDHVGGLRAFMHVGATIITHVKNHDFLVRDVLNYSQRTLKPDMVSLWPPTELAEGYFYEAIRENFVISDGTRNLNVHYMNPLQHVEGMLMAYLPGEKLLFQADIFDTDRPRPAAPTQDQRSFYTQVGRLGLDVAQIVPVHGAPVAWTEFAKAFTTRTN